jgi:hypothetical protein
MERAMTHWNNDESRVSDDAAIARMQARLEAALGAAFDTEVVRPSAARSVSQLRRLGWLGGGAMVAVGIALWSLRPGPPEPAMPAPESVLPVQASGPIVLPKPDESPASSSLPDDDTTRALPAQPERRASAARQPKPRPAAISVKPAPSAPSAAAEPGLAEELSGLDQIRALMFESPKRALAAAEQQQQQFPRGALRPERALLQLDALLRLGRASEAQQLAQQLLAAPANQPYRARILKLLNRAP